MNDSRSSEMNLSGFDLVKFLHIFVQIIFIPVAIGCLQHNFQILVPLPIGIFILLSIFCNFVVFIPHLLEHRHRYEISKTSNGMTIVFSRFRKRKSANYDFSKYSILPRQIHESFGWLFVFMLGFAWNFYLTSEGMKLISLKAFYQGLPMFSYGMVTAIFYLLMWFLPDKEIMIFNEENPKKSTLLLVPSVIMSFKLKKIYFGKKLLQKLDEKLKIEMKLEHKSPKSYLQENWIQIFQACTWLVIFIFSATFAFDFFHYQFVAAFDFIMLSYFLRKMIYKNKETQSNPWWIYPFWLLTLHEVGIKAWHLTALGVRSTSSIIWTLPISWILYILILTATVLEMFTVFKSKGTQNKNWIVVLVLLLVEIGLQLTAILSTYRILPFYLSLIEIGPII